MLFLSDVDRRIQTALEYNLGSAVTCALLCLKKPQFSTMELYMAITSLSYQGMDMDLESTESILIEHN